MLRLITLPFRWVRAARYALIAIGAVLSGLGLWMQINGVPPAGESVVSGLGDLMALVIDGPSTVFGVFSKIGGVLAMLGLFGMTVHDIAPAKTAEPETDFVPEYTVPPVNRDIAASTWQERLAAKTGQPLVEKSPRTIGSVLRNGLIGLVIFAFLAVLGATLLGGNIGNTSATSVTSGPGQAMVRTHLAAAGAISEIASTPVSAIAAFDIPKLDPATIVPWVKEQLALALAGDQAAMVTLGSIFGGIFVMLLGIKIMFALRRDKATLRASSRRISYS